MPPPFVRTSCATGRLPTLASTSRFMGVSSPGPTAASRSLIASLVFKGALLPYLFGTIGTALIDAKTGGMDRYKAIEAVLPWNVFTASVLEAGQLARDESFDLLLLVGDYDSQLRRYEPAFLAMFEWGGAPVAAPLLAAVNCLRELNDSKARKLPRTAPSEFLRKR